MPERIRHEHQTPMFSNGFSVAHAILVQAQMRFTVLIKSFHLPDIMPPQVEAFTKYISRPRHRYATCSLWRCPRCLAYVSPLPASRAGALAYPCPIASRYHIPLTIGACQYREKIPS